MNLKEAAGDEATVEITSDQTVFDVNVDYAYKNWLEAELEGTTITVRTTQTNPTTEDRTGVVSVVAGENGITATAYISVVQAANSSIPVLELSTDRVSLPQDASESVTVDVNTNQTISLSVDADAQSWCSAAYADGKITITALSANTNAGDRTATVTVTAGSLTDEITVTQSGESASYLGKAYGTEGVNLAQGAAQNAESSQFDVVHNKRFGEVTAVGTYTLVVVFGEVVVPVEQSRRATRCQCQGIHRDSAGNIDFTSGRNEFLTQHTHGNTSCTAVVLFERIPALYGHGVHIIGRNPVLDRDAEAHLVCELVLI